LFFNTHMNRLSLFNACASAVTRRQLSHVPSNNQPLKGRHLIGMKDIADRKTLDWLLDRATHMRHCLSDSHESRLSLLKVMPGYVLGNIFMEPSTRTSSSFEVSMLRLGGAVVKISNETSSVKKGETLHDTIKTLDNYCDIHVLRHPRVGAAAEAAAASSRVVINAGDGHGEHPTQALLDMFCVKGTLGRIDNVHFVLCGDLLYGRTAHSLTQLMALCVHPRLTLASPRELRLPDEVKSKLERLGVRYTEVDKLSDELLASTDVLYQTRVQRERFESEAAYDAVRHSFVLNRAALRQLPTTACIMHPLPRIDELHTDVDGMTQATYFRQPGFGLNMRMALLAAAVGRA